MRARPAKRGCGTAAVSGAAPCCPARLALVVWLAAIGCGGVARPEGVPQDATYVAGVKVGWWQDCRLETGESAVRCKVWNQRGLVLEDGYFLPYDGGPQPTATELKIDAEPKFPGSDLVYLVDGRILLPESRFGKMKDFVDWSYGKPSRHW